jgi:hypothetical protein
MEEQKTYLVNIESNLNKYAEEAALAKQKVDELKEANKKLVESGTASAAEMEANNAALKVAQKEYLNAKKTVEQMITANRSAKNSYFELYNQWQLAQVQLKKMGDAYVIDANGVRVLSEKYITASKVVADAKSALDQFGKGVHDNRLNVGSYSEAIEGAIGGLNQLPGTLGKATSGFMQMTKAALAFIATPIGAILAAITGAIYLIKEAIQVSQPLMDKLSVAGDYLSAMFRTLINYIAKFVEGVVKAFSDPIGAIKDFGQAILNNIINRFTALPKIAIAAFTAVKEAIKGNFDEAKEAVNDLGLAFVQMQTGIDTDKMEASAEAMKRAAEIAAELRVQLQALEDKQISEMQTMAKLERDTKRLLLAVEQEGISRSKQIEYLDEAILKQKQLSDNAVEDAKARAKISQDHINSLNETGSATRAERKANEEFQVAVIKAEEEAAQSILKLSKKRKNLLEQNIADEKEFIDKTNALRKKEEADRIDQMIKDLDFEIKAQLEANEKLGKYEQERLLINAENKRATQEALIQDEFALKQFQLDQDRQAEIDAAEKTGADVALINEKYNAYQLTLDEELRESKLGITSSFVGALAGLFGKSTKIGRMAAVAQATIDTYAGAQAAFKANAGIPPSPLWGIAAAATATIAGLANVKAILSVKSGLPGDSGGSAPTAISQSFAPAVGSSYLTQSQLTQSQVNSLPSGGLSASDIQDAVKNIPAPIVTVEDINAKVAEVQKVTVAATI